MIRKANLRHLSRRRRFHYNPRSSCVGAKTVCDSALLSPKRVDPRVESVCLGPSSRAPRGRVDVVWASACVLARRASRRILPSPIGSGAAVSIGLRDTLARGLIGTATREGAAADSDASKWLLAAHVELAAAPAIDLSIAGESVASSTIRAAAPRTKEAPARSRNMLRSASSRQSTGGDGAVCKDFVEVRA